MVQFSRNRAYMVEKNQMKNIVDGGIIAYWSKLGINKNLVNCVFDKLTYHGADRLLTSIYLVSTA